MKFLKKETERSFHRISPYADQEDVAVLGRHMTLPVYLLYFRR